MADSTISENLFKPTREAIPEEFLNKPIRLSRKYGKRRNGTAVSREIAELLKMRFPEKEEALDKLSFSFVREGSTIVKVAPQNKPGVQNFLSTRITGNEWCPLTIDVILLALGTRNENALKGISAFVSFLRAFSQATAYIPPEQRRLSVLFNWFVKNVWFEVAIENFEKNDRKWRLLTWIHFPRDRQHTKRAIIPDSFTLKDIATHILSTGTILSDKQGEKDWHWLNRNRAIEAERL